MKVNRKWCLLVGILIVGLLVGGTLVWAQETDGPVKNLDTGKTFTSIQAAIDDDDTDAGDSIEVAAGTYVEQLDIAKAVTIVGVGTESTTIKSPIELDEYTVGGEPERPIVYIDTDDVTIKNLTVDGVGYNHDPHFEGVVFDDAGGTLQNLDIKSVRDDPLGGRQHGVGVYAVVDDGTSRTVKVKSCEINDFQKNGITFKGSDLYGEARNNTVTGAGKTTVIAQNGIQFSGGATGVADNNTIADIWYTYDDWGSTGVLPFSSGSDGVTISNNSFNNTEYGVWPWFADKMVVENNDFLNIEAVQFGSSDHSTFRGNTIDNVTRGLELYWTSDMKVSDNNFTNSHSSAIYLYDANTTEISYNSIEDTSSQDAISIKSPSDNILILDNSITNVAGGIHGSSDGARGAGNGINIGFVDEDFTGKISTGIKIKNNEISGITTPDVDGPFDVDGPLKDYSSGDRTTATGIQVLPRGKDLDELEITGNEIYDIEPGKSGSSGKKRARGIAVHTQMETVDGEAYGVADSVVIDQNEIHGLTGERARAIALFEDSEENPKGPKNFKVRRNKIYNINGSEFGYGLYVGGYLNLGDNHEVSYNSFEDGGVIWYLEDADTLNASLNWWGNESGPTPINLTGEPVSSVAGSPVMGKVAYSPWLGDSIEDGTGIDTKPDTPGVQLPNGVNIIVDDVGPTQMGYLDRAIWGANSEYLSGKDTIKVRQGTYNSSEPINETVNILGPNSQNDPSTGSWDDTIDAVVKDSQLNFDKGGNHVTIKGLTFTGDSWTFHFNADHEFTPNDIDIIHNRFMSKDRIPININTPNRVNDDWIIHENLFKDVTGNDNSAFYINNASGFSISGNLIDGTGYAGMILIKIEDFTISGNEITNTPRKGIQVAHSPENPDPITIKNNYIHNTITSDDEDEGAISLYADVENVNIKFNELTENYRGFVVRHLEEGEVSDTIHLNFNSIYNNREATGLVGGDYQGGTLDATLNWWGNSNGPSHSTNTNVTTGDAVTDNVIYSPWLHEDPDTGDNSGNPGVQLPNSMSFMVDDVGPKPDKGYLKTAVEASTLFPGDDTTIYIRADDEGNQYDYDAVTNEYTPADIQILSGGSSLEFNKNEIMGKVIHKGEEETADFSLNYWGSPPNVGGNTENLLLTPWLEVPPGTDPMIYKVDDIGAKPEGGVNRAIEDANNDSDQDLVLVNHGTYDADQPIQNPITILSQEGSATNTFLSGPVSIESSNVEIGGEGQGFAVDGDVVIPEGVNASGVKVNKNIIKGTVIHNGKRTADFSLNYWPGEDSASPLSWPGEDSPSPKSWPGEDSASPLNWPGEDSASPLSWPGEDSPSPKGTYTPVEGNTDSVIYSPFLARWPGVSPMTYLVDYVGADPEGGLIRAIEDANTDTDRDTVVVNHGSYDAPSDQSITESVRIVSVKGSPANTFINGDTMNIDASDVTLGKRAGYVSRGFTVNADVTVGSGVDASTIEMHWNNLLGEVTNNGNNELDATYNWWGDMNPSSDIEGKVDYDPYLPEPVGDVMDYMEENGIDNPANAVAGMIAEDASLSEQATAQLTGMGLNVGAAGDLLDQYGTGTVLNAMNNSDTSGEFVQLLNGFSLPAGAAGGLTNNVVAGGAGSVGGKTVGAVFQTGETIEVSFPLADFEGDTAKDLYPTVSLVSLNEDGEKTGLDKVSTATYSEDETAYVCTFETTELTTGYYQVQIDLPDGSSLSQVVELEGETK